MNRSFRERHEFVVESLNAIPGVRCLRSNGAFYAFPHVQEVIDRLGLENDLALTERLIEHGVALVPGSAFGAPGYMRLSFATSMDNLRKGLERIADCLGA
jgi:aspartate aminotransferase